MGTATVPFLMSAISGEKAESPFRGSAKAEPGLP